MPVVEPLADKQFLTEKELAALLRVVPSCVRAIGARGEIAFLKLGDLGWLARDLPAR